MSLGNIPLFAALSQRLSWLGERQQLLAQNIANADTPGYIPRDLKEPDFLALARKAAESGAAPPPFESTAFPDTYETNATGNAVVLEQQLFKVAQTGSNFQLMTSLYRKHVELLKLALGRG